MTAVGAAAGADKAAAYVPATGLSAYHPAGPQLAVGGLLSTSSTSSGAMAAGLVRASLAFSQRGATAGVRQPANIAMSLPLVRGETVRGDVQVLVSESGSVALEAVSLRSQLAPLLNDQGEVQLDEAIGGEAFVSPAELAARGIRMSFDRSLLQMNLDGIAPELREVELLGESPRDEIRLPTSEPAEFSAYLNFNANFEYDDSEERFENPELFLFGATRFRDVAIEYDGGFSESFDEGYRFYRRAVRAVYDEPDKHLRFSAGDLRISTIPLLRTQFIGGVAVEKRRELFDPFEPVSGLGGRRIFIDTPSTLQVIVGGAPYQTFDVDPGVYDLAELPVQYGSNDVQIVVRDAAGREQVMRFDYFFDPIDLAPGEDEYTAAAGFISEDLSFEPDYSDELVFVGAYRRAFDERIAAGAIVQISEDRQAVGAELRLIPKVIPGSFDLQVATSFGDGTGFAFRAGYRWADADPVTARRVSATVDYQSADFRLVGDPFFIGVEQWTLSASYSQNFNSRMGLTAGLTIVDRSGIGDQSTVFADFIYRIAPNVRASAGIEYGEGDIFPRNFGVRLSLTVLFGGRNRADSSYESRREVARASVSRSLENHVGSWGYDLTVQDTDGRTSADARASYVGNRFDARISVVGSGSDLGSFGSERVARLQVGTTLAFADGVFGIGRTVNDAFVLVRPHETLGDREVITGRELNQGVYEARSGTFGAAVAPQITSYNPQDVLYDVDSLEPGYDIGSGISRVDLPYRGAAVITVGNERFVSVVGSLEIDGQPAELATGSVASFDDEGFEPTPFFTNSVGRFGIIGLAPGRTYVVRLTTGESFEISVPEDNTGLYRMDRVNVTSAGAED